MEPEAAKAKTQQEIHSEKKEANGVIATGVGVGALGAAGALVSGVVCPICIVVTPALIGTGVYKRMKAKKRSPSG